MIASSPTELEQAFQLLASNYRARGFEPPGPQPFRFTPYHALPGTATLVAKHGSSVVAMLSLVPDTSLLGLPMERIYGEEIESLRRGRRRLAEATSLADRDLSAREFLRVFTALIRLAMQYHIRQGGDSWVITVNPRHRQFYCKVLGFVPLGSCRSYPAVAGHPAEAFLLDAESMRANAPEMHQATLGEPLPDSVLTAPPWSPSLMLEFGSHSTQTDPRTIANLLARIQRFGCPPRWQERSGFQGRSGSRIRSAGARMRTAACGC